MHEEHQQQISDEDLLDNWKARIHKVARTMARNYRLSTEDAEDIVSACQLKLIQVPMDVRHNVPYILKSIDNAARTALSKLRAKGGTGTDSDECRTTDYGTAAPRLDTANEDDDTSPLDRIAEPDTELEERITDRITLKSAFSHLSDQQQTALLLYYEGDLSQAEVGRALGCSGPYASQILRRSLRRLRALLGSGSV